MAPHGVFDDLDGLGADGVASLGVAPEEDGMIRSVRVAGADDVAMSGLVDSPPVADSSDVFDFLTTPRTDLAAFGAPQVFACHVHAHSLARCPPP